jgi:hypothetical protein
MLDPEARSVRGTPSPRSQARRTRANQRWGIRARSCQYPQRPDIFRTSSVETAGYLDEVPPGRMSGCSRICISRSTTQSASSCVLKRKMPFGQVTRLGLPSAKPALGEEGSSESNVKNPISFARSCSRILLLVRHAGLDVSPQLSHPGGRSSHCSRFHAYQFTCVRTSHPLRIFFSSASLTISNAFPDTRSRVYLISVSPVAPYSNGSNLAALLCSGYILSYE